MKKIVVLWLLIFPVLLYAQQPFNYRVKSKPVIITGLSDKKILARVPRNKTLTFLSYDNTCDCFNVKYKERIGIVTSNSLLSDTKLPDDSLQSRLIAELRTRLNTAEHETMIHRKANMIRKYGYTEGIQVSEGKIWLGMSVDMTLDSRGIPYKVNRSVTSWENREQWIYTDTYLYFENGILTEIFTIKRASK